MWTRFTRWVLFALLVPLAPLVATLLIEGCAATGTGLVGSVMCRAVASKAVVNLRSFLEIYRT